ncbi:MAG: serine/threonine-protein kinase [Myxococcota bacterium]
MSAVRPPRSVHQATLPGLPRSLQDYEDRELDELTELAPGSQLVHRQQYDIVDRVGEGGMGKVYRAYDARMDRYIALKVLKLDVPESAKRRFRREAVIAANFSHPNLARVLDVGQSDELGIEWLTMEYLRGRDLGEVIDRGRPVTFPLMVDMMSQVLDALDYIHTRKIVHCDVKPDNIFITRDPYNRRLVIVKLIDFGVCRSLEGAPPQEISGDPRYMAPEQTMLGVPFDHRADVYSLGVTIFETITGRHPFEEHLDADPEDLLAMQCEVAVPAPSAWLDPSTPPQLAEGIDELIRKATAKRLDERFDSALHMKAALQGLLATV